MKKNNSVELIRNLVICSFIFYTFGSCNKTVYTFQDAAGKAQFVIYPDNYKYSEKSKYSRFSMWGKYEVIGDTIYFDVINKKKIPYTYISSGFRKLGDNQQSKFINVTVVDITYHIPVVYGSILMRDSLQRVISVAQTDLHGLATLKKSPACDYIEIDYDGFKKYRLEYQKFINTDILIEMERLDPGGLLVGNCIPFPSGATLVYKMKDHDKHKILEKNEIIFLSKN